MNKETDSKTEITETVAMLSALAQETRLSLFRLLIRKGPNGLNAGEIARHLNVPNSTLSYHLSELTQAGLILSHKEQRAVIYSANMDGVDWLLRFLVEDCCQGDTDYCFSFMPDKTTNDDKGQC